MLIIKLNQKKKYIIIWFYIFGVEGDYSSSFVCHNPIKEH